MKIRQCAYEFCRYSIKLKFAPSFQTAGFGVFAGRDFEQDEVVPAIWKALFLPQNFPVSQVLHNYVFEYNETHMLLVIDYGSILNHHESANVKPVVVPGTDVAYFRVRMGFRCESRNVLKIYNMHACTT